MNEETMNKIANLLKEAIITELNTPYPSRAYDGTLKRGVSPRKATGSLVNSLKVEWQRDFEQGDPLLVVSFDTNPSYLAQIIDQGRKPSFRFPPLKDIEKWVRIKPIIFRDAQGRFSKGTIKQRTFLVARSIKEKGFAGIQFLTKAENRVIEKLQDLGEQAALEFFEGLLDEGLVNIIEPI